jgi:hypothetical protein
VFGVADPEHGPFADPGRLGTGGRLGNLGRAEVDADHVDVVYSILLGEAEVLGQLSGAAVCEDGRWLVSRASYCQVATLGQDTLPEACQ